ncbi:hypothetical protein RJD24_11830 [Bacillaceae bacterium IKA-2]|jgi:hypothetical protein|nr:hypothetical protein RJD24_11830 [Bacillaceae bacterium IKA-2]
MKKTFVLFTTLFAFLTIFATTVSAAGGASDAAYQGPLVLLSFLTLAIFIFLPFKDHN